jgi:hypothetical protein
MTRSRYCAVSATLFCLVGIAHATRVANGWVVTVDTVTIPMLVSWLGTFGPACLALWGFSEARRGS